MQSNKVSKGMMGSGTTELEVSWGEREDKKGKPVRVRF